MVNLPQVFNNLQPPRIINLSSLSKISMKAPLLRAPNSETHQRDRSEPVQAAPSDPARSIYRICVPRLESMVSHLHPVHTRCKSWLGHCIKHLEGTLPLPLPNQQVSHPNHPSNNGDQSMNNESTNQHEQHHLFKGKHSNIQEHNKITFNILLQQP